MFTPEAGATWLLNEIDPEDPDIAFSLCDLGVGAPSSAMSASLNSLCCAGVSDCRSNGTCTSVPIKSPRSTL